jgi:hypothetical protein
MKIKNSAARNTMTPMERQCYDWGWEDSQAEIVKYIKHRIEDLRTCHKNDSCSDIAYVLEGCIEDIESAESLECLTDGKGCAK